MKERNKREKKEGGGRKGGKYKKMKINIFQILYVLFKQYRDFDKFLTQPSHH